MPLPKAANRPCPDWSCKPFGRPAGRSTRETRIAPKRRSASVIPPAGGSAARWRETAPGAAVAHVMPGLAKAGHDYVVIARAATVDRAFEDLLRDLETALTRIDAQSGKPGVGAAQD